MATMGGAELELWLLIGGLVKGVAIRCIIPLVQTMLACNTSMLLARN